jgi:hypothetical protein
MSKGRLLSRMRQGNRSEFLAMYGLSAVAFVNPVPRTEDFGVVDFRCVLTREASGITLPDIEFNVQVKSDRRPIRFARDAFQWVATHMNHPLLICVADKRRKRLSLYSCSPLWVPAFDGDPAAPRTATLRMASRKPVSISRTGDANGASWNVSLGPPIIDLEIGEIEGNRAAVASVLHDWVTFDAGNVARRRIGRVAAAFATNWNRNEPLGPAFEVQIGYFYDGRHAQAEIELFPILLGLVHNYRHFAGEAKRAGRQDVAAPLERKLAALIALFRDLPELVERFKLDLHDLETVSA